MPTGEQSNDSKTDKYGKKKRKGRKKKNRKQSEIEVDKGGFYILKVIGAYYTE